MKRILSFILVALMLCPLSVFAETTELGAAMDTDYYNVYIAGETDLAGKSVCILLTDENDKIGYAYELKTEDDGRYELKFKFNDAISKYKVAVRDGETAEDITSTLNTAFARSELYSLDVTLTNSGNDVTRYISEGDALDVAVRINNKYGNATTVNIIFAAYGENNKLLATDFKEIPVDYDAINALEIVSFSNISLPEGTKYAKAFAWHNAVNLLPLTENDVKENRGNIAFINDNPAETKVIGLVGDSITHHGNYAVFLNQYYATKYPESNVLILNKGISGDSASGIYNRLEWNILNENDPIGYGACDEIAVMVGMNDVGYTTFTKGPQDDYAAAYPNKVTTINNVVSNIEKIAEYCVENNIPVTLITPSLYDESDRFSNSLDGGTRFGTNWALGEVAKGVIDLGEKYDLPVLDLYKASNEYSDRIRENYPGATTVITGADGIHPGANGGYLFGYLFARAQETNEIVASVEIDANGNVNTTNATVTNAEVSSDSISYTYKANSLPLYVDSRYNYLKNYSVDIDNHMNQELIKVAGLEEGDYTVKFDGVALGTYSAFELANGVNIAALANNPGQIKAKEISTIITNKQGAESQLQSIAMVELSIRRNTSNKYYPQEMGTNFDEFSNEDWLNVAKSMRESYEAATPENERDNNKPLYGIMSYIETRKPNHETYAADAGKYSEQLLQASKTDTHQVVISK